MTILTSSDTDALLLMDRALEISEAIACEGMYHEEGTRGHDHGPAQYMVSMECPSCTKRAVFAFCAGRIASALAEAAQGRELKCSRCESPAPVLEIWRRIVPLNCAAPGGGSRS